MKILVVGLVNNIQLKRLREEAQKKGHIVEGCYSKDLSIYIDREKFIPVLNGKDLTSYDLVYLMVSKRRWEWYVAASYLNKEYRTIIVNQKIVDPSYKIFLSPASDYIRQYENDLPFPKSAIIYSSKSINSIENFFNFPLVIKPVSGRQGKDVYKVDNKKDLRKIAGRMIKDYIAIVIREYIANDGDIRVFTVGYKAIGAMRRIPPKGDFRSNISIGGRGEKFDLQKNPKIIELAEKVSLITKTEIAGVDLIIDKTNEQPYILEINPGPQFEGLEKYGKVNVALEIIKYFEFLFENRSH